MAYPSPRPFGIKAGELIWIRLVTGNILSGVVIRNSSVALRIVNAQFGPSLVPWSTVDDFGRKRFPMKGRNRGGMPADVAGERAIRWMNGGGGK